MLVRCLIILRQKIQRNEIKARTYHTGVNKKGELGQYELSLEDESDGTHRLMALAPAIDRVIDNGGIFVADELKKDFIRY